MGTATFCEPRRVPDGAAGEAAHEARRLDIDRRGPAHGMTTPAELALDVDGGGCAASSVNRHHVSITGREAQFTRPAAHRACAISSDDSEDPARIASKLGRVSLVVWRTAALTWQTSASAAPANFQAISAEAGSRGERCCRSNAAARATFTGSANAMISQFT